MDTDTPEYFYNEIQKVQTELDNVKSEDENTDKAAVIYNDCYVKLEDIRRQIRDQMDKIITDKPVKSQQMLQDYKDIYNTHYMTNFCLVLGLGLILWYIVRPNINNTPNTPNTPNVSAPAPKPI